MASDTDQHPTGTRERLLRWLAVGASLLVFAMALFALNRLLADVRIGEVLGRVFLDHAGAAAGQYRADRAQLSDPDRL